MEWGSCGVCGFGNEIMPLEIWKDADCEGWFVHELCMKAGVS